MAPTGARAPSTGVAPMATTTATRSRNTTSAKRSANARAEARDEEGRFKTEGSDKSTGSTARRATGGGRGKSARGDHSGTGALLGAGDAGLAVGPAANVARKLAVDARSMLAGGSAEAPRAAHAVTLTVLDAL